MFVKYQINVKYRLLFIIDFVNWRYHPYVGGHYQMSGIIWIARWQLPDYYVPIYIYIYSFYPSRLSAPISSAVSWRWYFLVRPNQHRRIYKLRLMKQNKRNMPHRAAHTHLSSVDRGVEQNPFGGRLSLRFFGSNAPVLHDWQGNEPSISYNQLITIFDIFCHAHNRICLREQPILSCHQTMLIFHHMQISKQFDK